MAAADERLRCLGEHSAGRVKPGWHGGGFDDGRYVALLLREYLCWKQMQKVVDVSLVEKSDGTKLS